MRILHPDRYLVYFILLNIPVINYHPMNLLPAPAFTSINTSTTSAIADYFTKPLSRHHFDTLIGDAPATPTTSVVSTPVAATVDPQAPTLVASTTTVNSLAAVAAPASDSVPSLHPNLPLPIVLDTGASFALTPFPSDFCVTQAPYGLIRSASDTSVASSASKAASTPADPYTLITGEDVSVDPFDLSSLDTTVHSDSGCLQAFTLLHLIPIWIYCLLHFAINLE